MISKGTHNPLREIVRLSLAGERVWELVEEHERVTGRQATVSEIRKIMATATREMVERELSSSNPPVRIEDCR